MLKDPLPRTLDVRKAALRGVSIRGALTLAQLPRLQPVLATSEGWVRAELVFSRDEENHSVIAVSVEAEVDVVCQRCLEPMTLPVSCNNRLAVVWTDEQAKHLPKNLDPLICEDDCALWELVEDELILALPAYSYHEQTDCNQLLTALGESDGIQASEEPRANPFDVLSQLKRSKD